MAKKKDIQPRPAPIDEEKQKEIPKEEK